MNDDKLNATLLILMMILPLSALISRRIPWKKAAGMAAIWAAVLVGGVLIVGLTRDGVAAFSFMASTTNSCSFARTRR